MIPDQSNLNQYIATGLRNAKGASADLGIFSGGTMPNFVRDQIVNLIAEALQGIDTNIPNNIPSEIYDQVADIMLPFTPSLNRSTLTQILRSNAVFGQLDFASPNISSLLTSSLDNFIADYERKVREMTGTLDQTLSQFGISGGLAQAVESITGAAKTTIQVALSNVLSPSEVNNVIPEVVLAFTQGSGNLNVYTDLPTSFSTLALSNRNVSSLISDVADPLGNVNLDDLSQQQRNQFSASYIKAASGTDANLESLTSLVEATNGTIAGTTDTKQDFAQANPYVIAEDTIDPAGSFISSIEELEAEMSRATRGISEIIVHWSETFTNANLSGAQLTELTDAGDNVYHLIIRRDGSLERGVDLDAVGDHCDINNHNAHSIGVCLIGGLNVATGAENLFEVASARSITRSQYNTLYQVFRVFFNQYPGGQALGHMDIDPNQEDPGFDVRDYVFNNFNKQSLYTDPVNDPALTPADILEAVEKIGLTVLEKDPDVMEKKF